MKRFSVCIIIGASVIAGFVGLSRGSAEAQSSFDGGWSVVITTDRGDCDPASRLSVDIRGGSLQYAGDSSVSIHGQVVGDGQVRVHLTNGRQTGNGVGRLSTNSGAGTWHGQGLASSCMGRWSAARR